MYLPPYSPGFNPIEECFSFIKGYIHHHGLRFCAEIESGEEVRTIMFLYEMLHMVTP